MVRQPKQCRDCGRQRRIKGSYPIVLHTLFGDVRLTSRRLFCCRCGGHQAKTSSSPLAQLLPDHVAPERLYLETRWSSLVSYAAAAELLSDVLPVTACANTSTTRRHVLRVAERIETELPEVRSSGYSEGVGPRLSTAVAVPLSIRARHCIILKSAGPEMRSGQGRTAALA